MQVRGGRSDMEAAARDFAKGPPATEGLVLRTVMLYFERTGTEIEVARRTREHTLDLLLKDLRRVMNARYGQKYDDRNALRRERRLGTMTTKVKKVFLDRQSDTGELMLAAGLRRDGRGSLSETEPSKSLFSRLYRDAKLRNPDGRRRKPRARQLSMDSVLQDLNTLVSVDADGLWDKLVPWLRTHNFEVVDLEATGGFEEG